MHADVTERAPDAAPPDILPEARPRPGGAGWLALVLVLGAFAVVLAGVRSPFYELERHAVPKELALHATALLCLAALLPRWRRMAPGIVEGLLALFVVWSAGSALLATNRWLAFSATGVSFSGLVLFIAARRVAASGRARRFALTGLVAAAVLAAALGVGQAYGLDLAWLAEDRPPGGTFGNRNFLAHFLAIASPPVLLTALRARQRGRVLVALVALLVMVGAIVLTRSRAAWLGFAAALCVMGLVTLIGRRVHPHLVRRRRVVLVAGVFLLAAGLATLLPNRLAWRSDSPYVETLTRIADYGSGSGRGRLIQWRTSLALFAERPIQGVGPGNWIVHYPRVTRPGDPSFITGDPIPTNPWPSSDWVATLSERGAVGTLLLLMTGFSAAVVALRRILVRDVPEWPAVFDPEPGEERAAGAVAALGMICAAFVTGLFDAVLLLPAPTFLVWAALGLLLPATRPVLDRPLAGRTRRLAITAVAGFALLTTLYGSARLAAVLIARERPDRPRLELAARLDPGGHRVLLLLARTGRCPSRIEHARAAAALLPFHDAPQRALRTCGQR